MVSSVGQNIYDNKQDSSGRTSYIMPLSQQPY